MGFDKVLITGCFGLVGSETVKYFSRISNLVIGIDANLRKFWYNDANESVEKSLFNLGNFKFHNTNVAYFDSLYNVIDNHRPQLVIHCATQSPYAGQMPYNSFLNNTLGTVNLLHCIHRITPESIFIFLSTAKVYGDNPNKVPRIESEWRYDLEGKAGIDESMSIDQCTHSHFGASKASADLIVQEYGKSFGMKTACFRSGCVAGRYGFLSCLCKAAKQDCVYTIYGHQGKQVRDSIHAFDLANAFYFFAENPRCGETYNIGGGYENSCSVNEAIHWIEQRLQRNVQTQTGPERPADLACYYSNNSKFKSHYPNWHLTRCMDQIYEEIISE